MLNKSKVMKRGLFVFLVSIMLMFSLSFVPAGGSVFATVFSSDDAYTDSSSSNSTGDGDVIYVWSGNNGTDVRHGLVDFNEFPSIPSGTEFFSATLELFMYNAGDGLDSTHSVYRIEESWDEETVTWDTEPDTSGSASDTTSVSESDVGGYVSFDVTSDVADLYDGGDNFGWLISDDTDNEDMKARYRSKDFGNESFSPRLVLEFVDINETNVINIEDLLVLLGGWGLCGEEFNNIDACNLYDYNDDGEIDKLDLEVLLARWGLDANVFLGSPDINGDGVVDVTDLLQLLAAWGACGEEEMCPADILPDGDVNDHDLNILLASWGEMFDIEGELAVDLTSPGSSQGSLTVTLDYDITGGVEPYSCSYEVLDSDNNDTVVLNVTDIENCTSIDFEVPSEGAYEVILTVEDSESTIIMIEKEFSVNLPNPDNDSGGGGSSGSSGGGGSGGGCVTNWNVGEWGPCVDGLQTREITPSAAICVVLEEKPATERVCEVEEILESQGGIQGFISRLTGAVVQADDTGRNRPTTLGFFVFLVIIAVAYFIVNAVRSGGMSFGGSDNTKKSKVTEKTDSGEKSDTLNMFISLFPMKLFGANNGKKRTTKRK